jgi:hypothetical protein
MNPARYHSVALTSSDHLGARTRPGRIALIVVGLVLAASFYGVGVSIGGRSGLLIGCLSTLILTVISYEAIVRLLPTMFGPRVIVIVFAVQTIALILILISGGSTIPAGISIIGVDLAEHIAPLCMSQIFALVGTVAAVLIVRAVFVGRIRLQGGEPLFKRIPAGSQWLILVAIILLMFRLIISAALESRVRYGLLILTAPLEFVPFVAGRLSSEYQSVRRACLTILILTTILGFFMGSRHGINQIALYVIGSMTLLRGAKLRRAIIRVGLVAVLLLYIAALVGIIRGETGRDNITLLQPTQMAQTLALAEHYAENGELGSEQIQQNGVARLLAWPNAAVVVLAPDPIPYRGLNSILEEISQYAIISGGSTDANGAYLANGLGTAPASGFGFLVNTHTSVEFGLVADGWSKGGPFGVILICYLFTTSMILLEVLVSNFRILSAQTKVLLLCIVMNTAFMVSTSPAVSLIRSLILQLLLWALVLFCIDQVMPRRHERLRMRRRNETGIVWESS